MNRRKITFVRGVKHAMAFIAAFNVFNCHAFRVRGFATLCAVIGDEQDAMNLGALLVRVGTGQDNLSVGITEHRLSRHAPGRR